MIKTINLIAGIEMAAELMGGCHVSIENRGSGVIYASKSSGITADSDGVTAIDSGSTKILRNVAQYRKNDNSYDYYGKIYLLSASDAKAEIQTANDLNFFSRKNSKGGETIDAYTKSETDIRITEKVAEIVADAPEDFDTLKEMSDWIASHENDASAMNSAIQTNATNISDLQTDKVGKNDFATKTTGGVVKIDSTYGIDIENGTAKTVPAYDNFLNAFTDDNHVITPYRFKKAMNLYGIDSQTQIADMQTEIDGKVDNDIFVAENLIHYPYNNDTATSGGITFTDNEDGSIAVTGSVTKANTNYNYKLNPNEYTKLEIGQTYILNNCGDLDDDCYLRLFYKADNGTETYLASTKNGSYTFAATETINEVRIWITVNCADTTKEFNNTIKPMLEIGSIAHRYQPYQLSKQSMRDDINTLMALLT